MLFLNVVLLEKTKELVYEVPVPDKINDESTKSTKDPINIILKYCLKDQYLIKRMQSYKLYICQIHFTPDQIYIYPTRKMLKESALPTLNLPWKSASSTTKPREINWETWRIPTSSRPNVPTSRIFINRPKISHYELKAFTLTKSWKVEVKEQL